MENVNANIREKLVKHYPKAVADLAMKAIVLSEEHGTPSAAAEHLKTLILKHTK